MERYLTNFDTGTMPTEHYDAVIIGSGIAGVYTALQMEREVKIAIVTKETLEISNSVLAQGGIAVSLDKEDSPTYHFKDTLYAGAGLCDEQTVWALVNEAAENIGILCRYGENFDRSENHQLALSREAAHSKNRIIHTGDATGKEVCDSLIAAVLKYPNGKIHERTFARDIVLRTINAEACWFMTKIPRKKFLASDAVICASGGYGQLYHYTTNPPVATGDGAALAHRAGCKLMDLEFVQFHPTVLFHPENRSFLISEAVRGEGAILLNANGERFMPGYHPMAELAPRDVVSRAIFEEIQKNETTHVFLDISHKDSEYLRNRFPNIYKTCLGYGIDITKDRIPVAPAEHYCMGGIQTDAWGRTGVEGFYACGEAACNGIHGANRLASNSLLEGLVFGKRIAQEVSRNVFEREAKAVTQPRTLIFQKTSGEPLKNTAALKAQIRKLMTNNVGIIRNEEKLQKAMTRILEIKEQIRGREYSDIEQWELINMVALSEMVIKSALLRTESRGAHYRTDYPQTDDIHWKKNTIL